MTATATALPQAPSVAIPLVLSERRNLRFVTLFLFYVAQGLPFGLIDFAIPAWLAQNGASAAQIGSILALAILPWTFKLAYGFVMDRYAFLAMGRRRPWIIIGQLGIVAGFGAIALVNPGMDQLALLGILAFLICMSSAIQDVAVDGLAVDILPPHEIERVNGFMFGGQAIGIAIGGALGGTLIANYDLAAAALALGGLAAMILLLAVCVRERPGERLLPWTAGAASQRNLDLHLGAFVPIVRKLFGAMFTKQTLILVPALILITACQGIFLGLAPLFATNELGWEKAVYSGWSSQAFLVAGVAAGVFFGPMAGRWGARRVFIIMALLVAASAAAMLALEPQWASPVLFIGAIYVFTTLAVIRAVTAGSFTMRLCNPAVAATQFAVFMAILNLGRTLGSASLGWLDGLGGAQALFMAITACALGAAAFATAAKVGR
jgi:MFS transporter, PAT family, beta-lactamase induction signal transducer AmpG